MKLLRVLVIGLALGVPGLSIAQWQWLDKDGRKVFSDQPPPADVPAKNILRRPAGKGSVAVAPEAATQAAASQPAKPSASAPKPSGKDKELEERKKQTETAEAEKKKAQEEEVAKSRAENCARAKGAKADLALGQRMYQTNAKGEREVLDDTARANEVKRIDKIIASDCKPAG